MNRQHVGRSPELPRVITFPPDAILERAHIAAALNADEAAVAAMRLPSFEVGLGHAREERFIWRMVLDALAERSSQRRVVTYPKDAIVDSAQVAAALRVSTELVGKMDLPSFGAGERKRFVWSQVLDVLAERAMPRVHPTERETARRSYKRDR